MTLYDVFAPVKQKLLDKTVFAPHLLCMKSFDTRFFLNKKVRLRSFYLALWDEKKLEQKKPISPSYV